ncbi:MAG: hypothetical protein RIR09_2350 [Pseudomonadota bacterium]
MVHSSPDMRLPTYVYRSRHGIYFFRIVVPLALRNALSGQREIKRSLRTRDKRQPVVESLANPHEQRACGDPGAIPSVLVKTEGQYDFSVRGPVLTASAQSALAEVGRAEAPSEPLGESHRLTAVPFRGVENPSMDAGQIRERIRAMYPQFSYVDTPVSAVFFQRVEGLKITPSELDEAARTLVDDPTQKLTAGALFDCLVAKRRRPRPRRLPGGLVL